MGTTASTTLEQARAALHRREWELAAARFDDAEREAVLAPEALEQWADCAYMLAREDESVRCLERAHDAYVDCGDVPRAVRCAFWAGLTLMFQGRVGPAMGWLSRAGRLLETQDALTVEHGYLCLPEYERHRMQGELDAGRR